MANLLVHYSIGNVFGKFIDDKDSRVIFYLGILIPDFVMLFSFYVAGAPYEYLEPSHSPLMIIFICYLCTLFFEEAVRKKAFLFLLIGSYLHICLDIFRDSMGYGTILWGFPFTFNRIDFSFYSHEHTYQMIIGAVGLIVIVEIEAALIKRLKKAK